MYFLEKHLGVLLEEAHQKAFLNFFAKRFQKHF